jgi:hypothetical protein
MTLIETVSKESLMPIGRFVRTDFYFDREDVDPIFLPEEFGEQTSLSAVWLRGLDEWSFTGENWGPVVSLRNLVEYWHGNEMHHEVKRWDGNEVLVASMFETILRLPVHKDVDQLRDFFRLRWRRLSGFGLDDSGIPSGAMPIVKQLLAEKVVIETSPPIAETLAHFLHNATSISLGVLLGTGLTHDPTVMMITIPAGMILMGAAMGITKGLERGLAKRVEAAITKDGEDKPKPRTSSRKKPKDE